MYTQNIISGDVDSKVGQNIFQTMCSLYKPIGSRKIDKPVILYGAGSLGLMAKNFFEKMKIPFSFVVDKFPNKKNSEWIDIDIVSPDKVPDELKHNSLLVVCIATSSYVDIANNLKASGWGDVVPFYDVVEGYRQQYPLSNGWFADKFCDEQKSSIVTLIELWGDDISRAHYLQFLSWKYLREELIFTSAPININDRFFIDQVTSRLSSTEKFLDVGAHHGNVLKRFMEIAANKFENVWAIEPDSQSLKILKARFAEFKSSNKTGGVEIFDAVISADGMSKKFIDGLGYASQISALGKKITTKTIDSLDIDPTFIKLHLEGAELQALRGGIKTIQKYRPIVVSTSYHNSDGINALPIWFFNNLDGYSIIFRMHSWCGTGAVIYAIPEERELVGKINF